MCQVGWGCWGVPRQAVEALGGEMLRVGAGVRVETLLVVLERQWVDQLECWRDVDDAGDRGVGSDDELHWLEVHSRQWVSWCHSIVATIVDAHP